MSGRILRYLKYRVRLLQSLKLRGQGLTIVSSANTFLYVLVWFNSSLLHLCPYP